MITTEGFRDVIEIGREKRYDGWDLKIDFRSRWSSALRLEAAERIHADGKVLKALDREALRETIAHLMREGVESLAVCLLHAYKNPIHEQAVHAFDSEIAPDVPVSLSSEVLPEINEYERVSTTVVNAYSKPAAARYLTRLEDRDGCGCGRRVAVDAVERGSTGYAREFPVRIIESGPAAGALGRHTMRVSLVYRMCSRSIWGAQPRRCAWFKTDGFPVRRSSRWRMSIASNAAAVYRSAFLFLI